METIVVAYDGSEPAERALRRAVELAEAFRSRLVVATVEPTVPPADLGLYVGDGGFGLPLQTEPYDPAGDDRWQAHLDEARKLVESRGLAWEFVSPTGGAAEEIVHIAEEHGADLIVVGTHERGALRRLFVGSVSAGVTRKAHCDVLVVHPGPPAA
jgi:nucleotide-binding universal stress UspA family protein